MTDDFRRFVEDFQALREAQKRYFATRDGEALTTSKRLEKELDQRAKELLDQPNPKAPQLGIFK